jgi:hypothetical protein
LPDGYSDIYGTKIKLEEAAATLEDVAGFTVYED